MSADLVLPGAVSETALDLPAELSFEQWEQVGDTLGRIGRAHQWWVGDWLNYGERAYGEKYAQAMDATGFDYSTLSGAAWVAKAIEPCRRRQNLTFSHHAELAKLEPSEQDEWFDRAETAGWSRNELRKQVKGAAGSNGGAESCPTCGRPLPAHMQPPPVPRRNGK